MKITTPEAGFTGDSVGVDFRDGVGYTDNAAALRYFRAAGYHVEEADAVPPEPAETAETSAMPRKSASKTDWVAYATAQGLDSAEAEALTRDQLAELFMTKENGQ